MAETLLKKIQPYVLDAQYDDGQVILREGEFSDAAYYIASGVVEILLKQLPAVQQTPAGAKRSRRAGPQTMAGRAEELAGMPRRGRAMGRPVDLSGTIILSDIPAELKRGDRAILDRGEIFGEISALSRYPVSATVRAASAVACVMIRTPALRILQRSAPKFKEFVDRRYRQRSLATHLRSVGLFAGCTDEFVRGLQERVELLTFEPGEQIAEEGTPADSFFLIRGGYVKVSAKSGAADLALTYLRKGDYFGEAAILLEEPWPFSFSAIESVELVKLSRADLQELMRQEPESERTLWELTVARLKQRGAAIRHPADSEYLQMAVDTGLIHGESVLLIDLSTLHALRRLRARVRRHARRHAALRPRGVQVPQLAGPDRLLPVHRSGLHDRLPDRRHHAAASGRPRSRSTR